MEWALSILWSSIAGTTQITFTYDSANCTQTIAVTDMMLKSVTFDSSAVKDGQAACAIDITAIEVEAF